MFELKPDFKKTRARMDAFWRFDVLDRPLVMYTLPARSPVPLPEDAHQNPEERWQDARYQAELALAALASREYPADALPIAVPNLGLDIFPALYGCPLQFNASGDAWTQPILKNLDQAAALKLDWHHPYLACLHEITDAMLAIGQGRFITAMPNWLAGGDALAALRDPMNLAVDLMRRPDQVIAVLEQIEADSFGVYDQFYQKLRAASQPVTSWLPLFCDGRFDILSNDFSCLISPDLFRKVFLPGIARRCQRLDHSIYHLDGPGALRHLESILSLPELDALQWVPGTGKEGFKHWVTVYQQAQAAHKAVLVYCTPDELELVTQSLSPRGLCLEISGVPDRTTGQAIEQYLERWTRSL